MNKAIVMTVCQRPWYLEKVLDGWSKVRGVKDWPFVFMVEPTATKEAMLRVISKFDHSDYTIVENEVRLGVLTNPWAGLQFCFTGGMDFVVLAEEDLLPSTNILEYFDWAMNSPAGNEFRYDESNILAVCAQGEGSSPYEAEFRPDFKVWLWGTWKDRWEILLRDTWDKDYSSGEAWNSGWDWNINLRLMPEYELRCLYPKAPLVDNLGQWAGAHAVPSDYEASRPVGFVQDIEPGEWKML